MIHDGQHRCAAVVELRRMLRVARSGAFDTACRAALRGERVGAYSRRSQQRTLGSGPLRTSGERRRDVVCRALGLAFEERSPRCAAS